MASKSLIFAIFFVKIIEISCKIEGSLTLVIDDTQSMSNVIESVKRESSKFMDVILNQSTSQISDVVIVTFNDPEKLNVVRLGPTKDRGKVKNALENIRMDPKRWGGDCPEYSLSGINMALNYSRKNSYLFVFTDASPKDGYVEKKSKRGKAYWGLDETLHNNKLMDVKKQAQSKDSQIFFFLTKSECHESERLYQPYWDIAAATNGQVFKINKQEDLKQFLNYMNAVISGEGNVITRKEITANKIVTIPFTVDEQTQYVRVSASTQGDDIFLDISSGPTKSYEKIAWTNNNKILIIKSPPPGMYAATVRGTGVTTILIVGRTDFTFQHGFSDKIPLTFSNEKSQPIEGKESHLLIKVSDPTNSVDIKSVKISSQDEKRNLISSLALDKVSDGFYATRKFLAPSETFLITVIGEGKKTGELIKRTAKTPIEPRTPNMDPVISVQGGGKHYTYNTDVLLTCKVTAYPEPKILWMDDKENTLSDMLPIRVGKKDFETKFVMKSIKHETVIYCCAENDKGELFRERVDLHIQKPFKVNHNIKDIDKVYDGEQSKIPCGITSHFPIKITWYKQTGEVIHSSDRYSITRNGVLVIKEVNAQTKGKYRCKASIVGDEATQETRETTVDIIPLAPRYKKPEDVEIPEGGSETILCNVFKGYPKPEITWEFKNYKSGEFTPLHKTSDRIQINNAVDMSAGVYKCIASNYMGKAEQEITVTVTIRPKATLVLNIDKTRIRTEYNKTDETVMTCHVLSHSRPAIVWKNGKNEDLDTRLEFTKLNGYQYLSKMIISQLKKSDTYHCEASNEISTVKSNNVYIDVSNPFTKVPIGRDNDIKKVYNGERSVIPCGIASHLPIKITWYKQTGEVIHSSDKYSITGNGVLVIKEVNAQTKGKYRCKASIVGDEATQETRETTVDIIHLAPRCKKPEDVEIPEGGSETILCNVFKGYPKPEITWEFKNYKSGKFIPLHETSDRIQINNADDMSAGVYKCIASNYMGKTEQEVTVTVTIRPKATLVLDNDKTRIRTEYNSAEETVMTCHVLSHSRPAIEWKNGKNEDLNTRLEFTKLNGYQYVSKMIISQFKKSDTYHCEASNEISTVKSNNVFIDVSNPLTKVPTGRDNNDIKKVYDGERSEIPCGITSHLPIKITWYKQTGEVIHPSDKYSITGNGVLVIKEVNALTKGKYRCRASIVGDEATQETRETTVDIIPLAPRFKKTEDVAIPEGGSETILCNVLKGYPKPEITWEYKNYKSGKFIPLHETSDRIQINNADDMSAGVYKCIASNYMGKTEQEITVTVTIRPKATLVLNNDKTRIRTEYNNTEETVMTCHVLSHSRPAIVWKNGKNEDLNTRLESTKLNGYQYVSKMIISQLKKSDIYHCEASNEISTVKSNNVYIDVTNPFTKVPTGRDNDFQIANYGERFEIPCGIKSNYPTRITWYKDTEEVVLPSETYLITEDGAVLTIKEVNLQTKGKYRCKATIIHDEATQDTHEITIDTVTEKPVVETKHQDLEIFRYQKASLKCKILKGIPRPKITWKVKYEKTDEFVELPEVGEELNIYPVMYNHSGLYKCILSNIIGTDEGTVRLFVKGPPEILTANDHVFTALVGDDALVIPCDVAGYPKPNVTWRPEFSSTYTKFNVSSSSLVINNPIIDDSDKGYVCKVKNEYGETEKMFYVVVSDKIDEEFPQDYGDIKTVVVLKDSTKHLKCESGSLKGRWYKQGKPIGKTGTLDINTSVASYDDEYSYIPTNYTCRIRNTDGSYISYTYSVKIEHKPILKEPKDEQKDWEGDEIYLSCEAYMRPQYETAEAKWFYNGQESHLSSGNAHQSIHPVISWGNYTCIISNYHGYVKKNFYVHSSNCIINKNLKGFKYPLMLDSSGSLPEEGHYVTVEAGEDLLLSCNNQPTQPNFFKNLTDDYEIIATCDHEDKFRINEAIFNITDLQCNSKVAPTLLEETGVKCFNENSELIKVGYSVQQPQPEFLEVYRVCFDKLNKVPIYSQVSVKQQSTSREENPEWLKDDNYYKENTGEDCTEDKKCCLAKKQLLSEIDVGKEPMKSATYIDGLNSIPYWHNCGSVDNTWSQLDDKIQRFNLEIPYVKISGALGYTSINGIMVPRYLWKLLKDSYISVVIVIVNDPHPTKADIRCSYDCPLPGWTKDSMHTFCCAVKEFMEAFDCNIDIEQSSN